MLRVRDWRCNCARRGIGVHSRHSRTDDVDAILHLVKGAHSHAVGFVSTLNTALIMRVSGGLYVSSASNVMSHVPELLCTYRC